MAETRGESRGETNVQNKVILKKAVEHRIKHLLSKPKIYEREVYDLVRGFFKKYIGIDYEFTSEELQKELHKVYLSQELQDSISILLARISEMEHVTREFSRAELEAMLADFKKIVDDLITSHYDTSKLKKIFHTLHHVFSSKHRRLLAHEEQHALTEHERAVVKMNILMDNAKRLAAKDMSGARKAYEELIALYATLDDDTKRSYYKPIEELYSSLKARQFQKGS